LYTGASNASFITEFRPVVFPHARMIYKLLLTLHNYHLCCFLTGTFAPFVAGKLDSFDGIATFVAMTDPKTTPVLCWLLQHLRAPPPQAFAFDAFAFTLTNAHDAHMNMFHYAMSYEDVRLPVTFVGVDTVRHCGPLSIVDLVHFVWENFIRFSYKKYALVLSPRGSDAQPGLLFLKHYRVDSDGSKVKARCDSCVESHRVMLIPFQRATGLSTARVRSVRGCLRPWPLVPSTSSSITRCICTGFDSMSKRHTIDTCTRPFRIV